MSEKNFFKFERSGDDFPFYKESVSPLKSLFLFFMIILGYSLFSLNTRGELLGNDIQPFLNLLFPIVGLLLIQGRHWTKLFRKIVPQDLLVIFATIFMCLAAGVLIAFVSSKFFAISPNPIGKIIEKNSVTENIFLILKTVPMLIGEELLTILPFLLILQLLIKKFSLKRKQAVLLSWIFSSLFFGVIHLKTYEWNIFQSVIGIGFIRMFLTYPYIKTKNLTLSIVVHILNDWILFLPSFMVKYFS